MEAEARRIYEENRQEGYQKGMEEAKAEGDAIKEEAQGVLDSAIREREETRQAVEPDAVNLIINIVDKLLGNSVKINPALVVTLIRQGFAGATLHGQVTIRVSENDYQETVAHRDEIVAAASGMAAGGGTAEIEIVRDLSLGPTDCIIDTPFGGIDVSLTPQFEALKEHLLFLLEH